MRKKGSGEDFSKKTCNFAEAATEKKNSQWNYVS